MWLGHYSPALTLATYVHLLPEDIPDPSFLDELTADKEMGSDHRKYEARATLVDAASSM
jgi:hypothetical protein